MMSQQRILLTNTLVMAIFSIEFAITLPRSAYAQEQKLTASLSGDQEVPPNGSAAKGWVWFEPISDSLRYKINVTELDTVMEAHIHMGKSGENGDPIITLFHSGPTGPINGTLIQGNFTASDLRGPMSGKTISYLLDKMENGETYSISTPAHFLTER